MATQGQVNTIKAQLARLAFKTDDLIKQPQYLGMDFDAAAEDLRKLEKLVAFLETSPLDYVLEDAANQVTGLLTAVGNTLEGIKAFNGNQGPGSRDSLVNSLHQSMVQLLTSVSPSISLLLLPELGTASGALVREMEMARRRVQEESAAVQAAAAAAREAAASAGAAAFSDEFAKEARLLEGGARRWLIAAGVFALATVAVAACFAFNLFRAPVPVASASSGVLPASPLLVQTIGGKLVILSMLLTAATWCGRNYKAQRHLGVLNKHRALSLRTFQAFSAAASDEVTKNAVLMEATRAIFSAGATGYVGGKDGSDESSLRIVEIAKGIGSRGSPT